MNQLIICCYYLVAVRMPVAQNLLLARHWDLFVRCPGRTKVTVRVKSRWERGYFGTREPALSTKDSERCEEHEFVHISSFSTLQSSLAATEIDSFWVLFGKPQASTASLRDNAYGALPSKAYLCCAKVTRLT